MFVLFAFIVAFFVIALVCLPLGYVLLKRERKTKAIRGFEVKLNSGPMPVLKEKDDDHG